MITINNSCEQSCSYLMNGTITVINFLNITKRWKLTQAVQKVKSFFLACYEDFIDISSQSNNRFLVETLLETNTTKISTRYTLKTGFLLRTGRIFGHIRKALAELANYARSSDLQRISSSRLQVDSCIRSYTNKPIRVAMIKTVSMRNIFFINYLTGLFSFSRQVAITQAEKLVFSFFACSSICSRRSWGKRIPLVNDLLFLYPVAITNKTFVNRVSKHYTVKNIIKKALTCICTIFYSVYAPSECIRFKKTMPRSAGTLSEHLTQPLNEVMIMANPYDSAHLRAEQSKLFKFYDLSTAQVVQSIASTEPQARKQLGKQSLIFVARIRLYSTTGSLTTLGGYSHE